ncbi:MAG TPA: MFS transporter [Candidatus Limnocylindrales bacterium]|jgi:EmrB/QacA subfamily drug resistance transporter|nr:MFS transporter [Candidatus Limnocylindrales bacterium]
MTPRERGTLGAAMLGSAIVFLDGTFVNIALQRIGAELPSSLFSKLEGQTYVTSGYLATLAAFLVLAGALGDYYGRRRTFLIGLVGFGITSIICGLSPNFEFLVLGRLLQGLAGSLLVPGSLAIITNTFEGAARARAFGLWAAVTAALGTLGPPIGGIIVELAGWRALFLLNVPLLAIAAWLTWRYMEESRDETSSGNFDWLGAIVAAVAVGGTSFGAVRGYSSNWQEPVALISLGIGVVALIAFPLLMARRSNPLVPLAMFRIRAFSTINLSTLLIYGVLYAMAGFQALFLQGTLGYTPLGASLIGLPTGILLAVLSTRVGALSGRIGVRPFMVAGPLVMAVGLLWWLGVGAASQPWVASLTDPSTLLPPFDVLIGPLPAGLIFGIGIALLVAPLTTGLMNSVPARNAGLASAINNALSRVGQPLLAAAVFIVVSGAFYSALAAAAPGVDPSSPEIRSAYQALNPPPANAPQALAIAAKAASADAYHVAVLVGAALLGLGALVNFVGLRPKGSTPAG